MFRQVDENGIDLVNGGFYQTEDVVLSIGDGPAALHLKVKVSGGGVETNFGGRATVDLDGAGGGIAESWFENDRNNFAGPAPSWSSLEEDGATLSQSGNVIIWTKSDGTTILFRTDIIEMPAGALTSIGYPTEITYPGGHKIKITYKLANYLPRIQSVTNSQGYQLKFSYASPSSNVVTSVQAINNAVDYCDPAADTCSGLTQSWPTIQLTRSFPASQPDNQPTIFTVTNTKDDTTIYTYGAIPDPWGWYYHPLTGIRRPGSSADNITFAYPTGNPTSPSTVTRDGVAYTYSQTAVAGASVITRTDPLGATLVVTLDAATGTRPVSIKDELNRTTKFTYDAYMRLKRRTEPEGNYAEYTYDVRGNVWQTRSVAKSGSGLADIVTSATYSLTCINPLTCNQPLTTTDPRNQVTNYAYDSAMGLPTAVTMPAVGGVHPETRFSYTAQQAYTKNGAGSVAASGIPVTLLTRISTCQTNATCAGTADEVVTTINYGPQSAGTPNNLLPLSVTTGGGDGVLTASSSFGYDRFGNRTTVDGPLSGTTDTTRMRYDSERLLVGMIGPDPDGAGPLKHRSARSSYDVAGQVTRIERGTVNSQSEEDWTAMSVLDALDIAYDVNGRPVKATASAAGNIQSVDQISYDALGRPDCAALRMNPAAFSSLPSSACSPSAPGSFGPDRIGKSFYDNGGRLTEVRIGVGTADEATSMASTYRNNGQVETVTDAEGNKTTFEYDGHDRLAVMRFPNPAKGAGTSSTTDYEQFTYDSGSNIVTRRLRDGTNIGLAYDGLNRLTTKDLPGSDPDVTYSYDLIGRLTSASQTGNALTFSYDALSRLLSQTGPLGSNASTYDSAGRRTRLTYAGGALYVDYDYVVTGEVIRIRENGATSGVGLLAAYNYDDWGRRTLLTRGDGTSKSYSYDAASRLTESIEDLPGTAEGTTVGFSYSPAGEIATRRRSNPAYAWNGHYNVNRGYMSNGLNQYTASGPVTPTYDAKGNLTSAGTGTYVYNSENMLTSASGGISLAYDPFRRLYQSAGGSDGTTKFAYDGGALIAEYDGSNALLRRYVYGPGSDEPLVWYEGTGTADRRFFHADERGTIVAITDGAGSTLAINAYDEYGIPAPTNFGRFQYTGQTWLPQLGMYDFKARIYSPTLGRFLQTDPIGYGGGMNLHAYVGNDPINNVDPSGRETIVITASPGSQCNGVALFGTCVAPGTLPGNEDSIGFVENEKGEGSDQRPHLSARCLNTMTFAYIAAYLNQTPYNTPLERRALTDWYAGRTTTMRLGAGYMARINAYVHRQPGTVVGSRPTRSYDPPGSHRNLVYFGKGDDEVFDGLLGSATVIFDADNNAIGVEDSFDMNGGKKYDAITNWALKNVREGRGTACQTVGDFRIVGGTGQ